MRRIRLVTVNRCSNKTRYRSDQQCHANDRCSVYDQVCSYPENGQTENRCTQKPYHTPDQVVALNLRVKLMVVRLLSA